MQTNADAARQGFFRTLTAIAVNACIVRYRLDRPVGALHILAAILDPLVYSGTIYFILATIFGRNDASRFHLLLLGVIAFRWTLSCLIQALNLHVIRDRLSEVTRYGHIGAIVAVMAPSTLAFLLSLSLALAWTIAAGVPGQSSRALWALPGVILFQCLWNAVLVVAVDLLRRARIVVNHIPIIAFAAIVWFLSPFMYRLDDIPASAGRLLTSFNPVSHVLAAYQNAYWYGRVPSLSVLPAAALVVIVGIVAFRRFAPPAARTPANSTFVATSRNSPLLVMTSGTVPPLALIEPSPAANTAHVFTRWHGKIGDFRGSSLARLILAARGIPAREIRDRLALMQAESSVGRLFDQELSIYPDWALDQLAFSLALSFPADTMVLQGLLNAVSAEFTVSAWRRIEAETKSGRLISVVADRPIPLPVDTAGRYRIVGPSGIIAEGDLRDGLGTVKSASPFGA